MNVQELYQKAIKFAASKHAELDQKIPSTNLPYVVHLSNVTMEIMIAANQSIDFDLNLAIPVALLHDVLEDTDTTYIQLEKEFGTKVAAGVQALTKNGNLPKSERMMDSLNRLQNQPKEIQAVKLADRITNLQPPPSHWNPEKIVEYHKEAILILDNLQNCNLFLAKRLEQKISEYQNYFSRI